MQVQITGKHIDLGDSLRERIEDGLEAAVTKYFDRPSEGHVIVSKDGYRTAVDCTVHLPSGIFLQASGLADDPYAALEDALVKMEKRVRRYKRRLKDHHRPDRMPMPSEPMPAFLVQSAEEDAEEHADEQSLVIAETAEALRTMSVAEAVMQLELTEAPIVFFKHPSHERVNLLYRRADGHIGWVDPNSGSEKPDKT